MLLFSTCSWDFVFMSSWQSHYAMFWFFSTLMCSCFIILFYFDHFCYQYNSSAKNTLKLHTRDLKRINKSNFRTNPTHIIWLHIHFISGRSRSSLNVYNWRIHQSKSFKSHEMKWNQVCKQASDKIKKNLLLYIYRAIYGDHKIELHAY